MPDVIEGEFSGEGQTTAVAAREVGGVPSIQAPTLTQDQVELLKRTIAMDCTNDELDLFVAVARRLGLDPFARQIFAVKRGRGADAKMTIQTSIDGFRLMASRSGKMRGTRGPWWCGPDGIWLEVWLDPTNPPAAAKVEVIHADYADPVVGIARWDAFVQTVGDGRPNSMWARMGDHMLAKCAESLALRRAFPAELSGIYSEDEMAQADGIGASPLVTAAIVEHGAEPVGQIEAPASREPEPPRARAAAPPVNAPRPGGPRKPPWADALKAATAEHKVTLDDIAAFLGVDANNGTIQSWLDGAEGRTVDVLARDAAALAGRNAEAESGADPAELPF